MPAGYPPTNTRSRRSDSSVRSRIHSSDELAGQPRSGLKLDFVGTPLSQYLPSPRAGEGSGVRGLRLPIGHVDGMLHVS